MENQRTMEEVLKLQREHYLNEGPPSYEIRIDRLDRVQDMVCLLYTSPSPRDRTRSRMPSSA